MRLAMREVEGSQKMNISFSLKTMEDDTEGLAMLKQGLVSCFELKKTAIHGVVKYPCLSITEWNPEIPDQL